MKVNQTIEGSDSPYIKKFNDVDYVLNHNQKLTGLRSIATIPNILSVNLSPSFISYVDIDILDSFLASQLYPYSILEGSEMSGSIIYPKESYSSGNIIGGIIAPILIVSGYAQVGDLIYPHEDDYAIKPEIFNMKINNGEIFSQTQSVVVTFEYTGNPVKYMISKFDDFNDTDWNYSFNTAVEFELYQIGVNTIYLKIATELLASDIVSSMIGWHGMEVASVIDTVELPSIDISEEASTNVESPDYAACTDSFVISTVDVSDEVTIYINDLQVYPTS